MLPVVRSFVSLPAGVAKMPFWRFTLYTALGSVPFVAFLAWLGVRVGANWHAIEQNFKWLDYAVIVAIVAAIVWAVTLRLRHRVG